MEYEVRIIKNERNIGSVEVGETGNYLLMKVKKELLKILEIERDSICSGGKATCGVKKKKGNPRLKAT
jgi:hypothetical protein